MPVVEVHLPQHSYSVHIAPGALDRLGATVRAVAPHDRAGLLADVSVMDSHGRRAAASLEKAGYRCVVHGFDAGEEKKNLATVAGLYDVLLEARLERRSPVVALGGGVTGDTVGFVAATYLRGVPLVQCPTTLLAMVDASVGGKVGVNVPQGKNLVGAFHQPVAVVIDTRTLATLPPRELRCGLAECIKHAVIRDASRIVWLEKNLSAVQALDETALVELVEWNVAIKARVVMADEKETGERAHLNFGHTFGHAIESTTGYGTYHHGEAVALGMLAATRLAVDLGRCPADVLHKLAALIERAGLPTRADNLPPTGVLMDAMRLDKKVAAGRLRLVLPNGLGSVNVVSDASDEAVGQAWESLRR